MYELAFFATDDADWSEAIELIDADTNGALADAATASFDLEVSEHGCALLTASTAASTITKPDTNVIAWTFSKSQMNGLCPGNTYKVGCRMTTTEGTIQLFVGTLAIIGGGF